jgi:hypothetical protein
MDLMNLFNIVILKQNCCENDDAHLLKIIKSVANWDYRVFSNGANIPVKYKKKQCNRITC